MLSSWGCPRHVSTLKSTSRASRDKAASNFNTVFIYYYSGLLNDGYKSLLTSTGIEMASLQSQKKDVYLITYIEYSNTSQTRGSKLAKFSNSRFLSLLYTSKLAVLLLSTQIRDFGYFLSPKNREFGGITVLTFVF